MRKLLDVTDRKTRFLQQGLGVVCGFLVAAGVGVLSYDLAPTAIGASIIALGTILLVVTAGIKQRWEIDYRGHKIRFENSAVTAERLFLDEGLVARGGLGRMMELRAPIRVGDGAGDEIVALVNADVLTFRLRLFVETDDPESASSATVDRSSAGPSGAPAYAHAVEDLRPVTESAVLGKLILAKDIFELIGALIGVISALSAAAVWLF